MIKFLAISLTVIASASALPSTWNICANQTTTPSFNISDVILTPDMPEVNCKFSIKMTGDLSTGDIVKGAYVNPTLTFLGMPLPTPNDKVDFCNFQKCPITVGEDKELSFEFKVPSGVPVCPPDKKGNRVNCYGMGLQFNYADGGNIACIDAVFTMMPHNGACSTALGLDEQ